MNDHERQFITMGNLPTETKVETKTLYRNLITDTLLRMEW